MLTHKWEDREGTCGRDSDSRHETFYQLCSNKFNEPSFKPHSDSRPELRDDFINRIPLFNNENFTLPLVSPNKIKVQLATSRFKVKMILH